MKFPKTPLDNWIQFKIGSKNAVLTRRELQNYQLERLQATLDLVCNHSAFYRERLRDLPKQALTYLEEFSQI